MLYERGNMEISDIDLSKYNYEDGVYNLKQSMRPEVIAKREKAKQIEELIGAVERDINVRFHPDLRNAFWYIHKIIKILRIMNGL